MVLMGQSPPGASCNDAGLGDPLLNGPTEFGSRHPTPKQWTTDSRRMCRENAVLLCVRGSTTGRTNRSDRSYAIGRGVAAIEVGDLSDQTYVYYALLSRLDALLEKTTGSVFPNLSQDDIGSLPVPWPPSGTRRAIAEVLGALDDKIEANRRVADRCEGLAQSLAALHPASTVVGAMAAVRRQMVSPKSFVDSDVEHFSLPAFDARGLPVVEPASAIKSGKFLLEAPAVLVSKLNPHIPRVWMAEPSARRPALTSTEFVVLVPEGAVGVEALWAICSSPRFTAQLVERVKGTTGSHQRVAPEDVLSIEVPDPESFSLATSDTMAGAVQLATSLKRESSALGAIRDALLPKLLSGELRVRDAETLVEDTV